MVKKEGTYLESLVVVRERDLMGTWAIFRRDCVAALHPRTAFLGLSQPAVARAVGDHGLSARPVSNLRMWAHVT